MIALFRFLPPSETAFEPCLLLKETPPALMNYTHQIITTKNIWDFFNNAIAFPPVPREDIFKCSGDQSAKSPAWPWFYSHGDIYL